MKYSEEPFQVYSVSDIIDLIKSGYGREAKMKEIITERLVLREFRESDYDDLFEYLSQLENDEFEGYPGITYENGREHLQYRVGSEEFYAIELKESGKVIGNIYYGNRDFEAIISNILRVILICFAVLLFYFSKRERNQI